MMNPLRRFADRVTLSELSAQKHANAILAKGLKRERNRANELSQNAKGRNKRLSEWKKRAMTAESSLRMVHIDLYNALRDDPLNRDRLETLLLMTEAFSGVEVETR